MSLVMPPEFFGKYKTHSAYTKTVPREWTPEEIAWIQECVAAGHSLDVIAAATDRTKVSVSLKLKRLSKTSDTYNGKHRDLKYAANAMFVADMQPTSVLDVYAGNSYYLGQEIPTVVTNDKDDKFETDYHLDAFHLMCQMVVSNQRFDVVDLDPYGSAYDCLPLAMKIAKKGLVVSFGEWGHKKWKRTDFVRPRYGIDSMEAFTIDAFCAELQRLARIEKKQLTVLDSVQYGNFLRVYCALDRLVITEQWDEDEMEGTE